MTLHLALLGRFVLTRDGEEIPLRSKKAQALLVYLVLTGKPQTREKLATLLWGNRYDDQARRSLRQCLFALRKSVGPDVIVGDVELQIKSDMISTDALSFRNTGETPPPYPGDILPDFHTGEDEFDSWLTAERDNIRNLAAKSYKNAAKEAASRRDNAAAQKLAQMTLTIDPYDEETLRLSMTLMAGADNSVNALWLFTDFSNRLKKDLDAEPGLETLALATSLRSRESKEISASTGAPARFHAVIAEFEDLGGGDIATFMAKDLPGELQGVSEGFGYKFLLPATSSGDLVSVDELVNQNNEIHKAQFILTGSARQLGSKVRVTGNILSRTDRSVVWSTREVFDADLAFDKIAEISKNIIQGFSNQLARSNPFEDLVDVLKHEIDNPEIFLATWTNVFWRANFIEHSRAHLMEVRRLAETAVERYPREPLVLVTLASTLFHEAHLGDSKLRLNQYRKASAILDTALALDPAHSSSLVHRVIISSWLDNHEEVNDTYDMMVESSTTIHGLDGVYGGSLVFQNRLNDAIERLENSLQRESASTLLFYRFSFLALANFMKDDFETALSCADSALDVGREFFLSHLVKIAALERLGRNGEAVQAITSFKQDYRDPTVSEFEFLPFTDEEPKRNFLDALRDAGLPE